MRIIAGKFKGRKLKSPVSLATRPTSDRLRETLFNILAPRIEGARFLDLCAGTGAVGIEALSRGAAHVTFVDQSRRMCALIKENVDALGILEDEVHIIGAEALDFLQQHQRKGDGFNIIFFDPPYATNYESVLAPIGNNLPPLLTKGGLLIVEHYKKNPAGEAFGKLQKYRELKQGDSVLSFYEWSV